MQIAQRTLLILTVAVYIMFFVFITEKEKAYQCIEQWEQIKTEEFLHRSSQNQKISFDEYIVYAESIKYLCEETKIVLEIYQREQSFQQKNYYYLFLQDEVQNRLTEDGEMKLREGSIIKVVVQNRTGRNAYYAVVSEKEAG